MRSSLSRLSLTLGVCLAFLVALVSVRLAFASPTIVIEGADAIWSISLEPSPALVSAAGAVAPRIAVEYGDAIRRGALEPSEGLRQAASGVNARLVLEYADAARTTQLGSLTPTATPTPTATAAPSPIGTPMLRDAATFASHVTVPEDSTMNPGQSFVKIWRLRNTGTTTWTTAYKLAFDGGEQMGASPEISLLAAVAPGATVDVSVSMTAPASSGTKRGYWKMKNASGAKFGDRIVAQILIPFAPAAELSGAIDSLVTDTLADLDDLDTTTLWMAQRGDALRGYIAADSAALAFDLLTGFASMYGDTKDWQVLRKAAAFKPGLNPGRPAGWSHILDLRKDYRKAGLWFDSALGGALRGDRPYAGLGSGLMNYGIKAYAANFRNKLIESVSQYDLTESIKRITSTSDGFSSKVYPLLADRKLIAMQDLNRTKTVLLASFPPMGAAQQEAWARDLRKRANASRQLVLARDFSKGSVQAALDLRSQAPDDAVKLFLLKFAAKTGAFLAFDGPGPFLVDSFLTAFELQQNTIKLSQDARSYAQAAGFMDNVPNDIDSIHLGAAIALREIRRGESPATVLGRIDGVSNFSRGEYRLGLFFSESDSFSDVTVVNTGDQEGIFQVIALYTAHIAVPFWPDVVFGTVVEDYVSLAPNGRRTVPLYYKKGSRGGSPLEDSSILIFVLGKNAAGDMYLVDSASTTWSSPVRLAGSLSGSGELIWPAAAQLPAMDNPINNYVVASGSPPVYEGQIWVNNIFTQTATATITQTLPSGVQIREARNAQLAGSSLVWNFTLPLSATVPVTYTFAINNNPGTAVTMPSPIMYLSDSLGNGFETSGDSLLLMSPLPVLTEAYPPLQVLAGYSATFPITLTNVLTDRAAVGSVTVKITDTVGNNVSSTTQAFSLAPAATGVLTFALPSLPDLGYYQVAGDLRYSGVGNTIFRNMMLVGSPGPEISMTSIPDGLVRAGKAVTYTVNVTNTTGLTLTDTVVTSTVPLSSSVLPGSVTGGGVSDQRTVAWTLPNSLLPGEAITMSFTVAVEPIAIAEDEAVIIYNSALVRSRLTYLAYSAETLVTVLGPSPPPFYLAF
ncbi:MAG: NBR1-Ig-like domain-containing protein, partial [Dehalococcoidia bacterium]|nr:NBR1-Ig-like domain-containing protein [Dehalococcoidia bacterium]